MSMRSPLIADDTGQDDTPAPKAGRRRPQVRKRRRLTAGARGRLMVYGLPLVALVVIITVFVVKIASLKQVAVPLLDSQELEAQGGLIDRDHPIPIEKENPPAPPPVIEVLPGTEAPPSMPEEDPEITEDPEATDPGEEDVPPATGSPIEVLTKVYAIKHPLPIYADPDTGSEVIRQLEAGDALLMVARAGDWTQVQIRANLIGYVRSDAISESPVFVPRTGESYYVQNRQVYVRSGPGTSNSIEGFALRGMTIRVLEAGDDWSKIRTEHGLTGYMHNELFGPDKPADEITELEMGRFMYIDTEEANLRESPSTDAEIIGAAFMDDRVYQISDNGGWSKVRTEAGVVAYVFNHLLRETPPANPFIKTNKRLYVDADSVNVRSSPTTDASVVTRLKRDAAVTELEANDSWSKVKLEGGDVGFIRSDLLTHVTPPPEGFSRSTGTLYVTTGAANIRSQPNTSSSVIVVARYGEKLTKKATGSSWTMVTTAGGKTGYISNDLVSANKPAANQGGSSSGGNSSGGNTSGGGGGTSTGGSSANADLRQRVVDIARSALGTPYRLSGKTMSAFDCSGLVKYTYEAIGYRNIPHGSDAQGRQLGSRVSFSGKDYSNLLPGDLIFFSRGYGYHHVGIYVGNNQMIHAVSGRGVVMDNLLTYPQAARVNRVLD